MKKKDLQERLIDFSVMIIKIADQMPAKKAGSHLAGQMIRSGTSVSLNYGEAQAGESKKDFIHKMQIVLKELRETYVCLQIVLKAGLFGSKDELEKALAENDELIAIFVKSIETAKSNENNKK